MEAKAKTRNVDTLRNVLVDELLRSYDEYMETSGEEAVMELFREADPLQRVAKRLGITFPPPSRLAGLALRRKWESSQAAR